MAPITSVALRFVGCTHESPLFDVKSASERLQDYSPKDKSHTKVVRSISKILEKLLEEEKSMLPFFLRGDVVWCVYGGYGFWPAVVGKVDIDSIAVHFSHEDGIDCLDVPSSKVKSAMKPFLDGFKEVYPYLSLSTRGFIQDFREAMLRVIPFVAVAYRDELTALVDVNARLRLDRINAVISRYLNGVVPFVVPAKPKKRSITQLLKTDERRKEKVIRDIEKLNANIREKEEKAFAVQQERERIQLEEDTERRMMRNIPAMLVELNESRNDHLFGNRVTRTKRVDVESSEFSLDDHLNLYEKMADKDSFSSNSIERVKYVYDLFIILKQMRGMQVSEPQICKAIKCSDDVSLVKLLLQRFYPVGVWHSPEHKGKMTILHYAVISDRPEVIDIIVDFYSQLGTGLSVINEVDQYGKTPMHLACEKGRYKCVQVLCRLKASVDAVCHSGWTPLMWCGGSTNSLAIVQHLLRMGADIQTSDDEGKTALYWYMYYGYTQLAQLMRKKGEWLNESELESYVQDMSLGLEKFPVILDVLPMDMCKIKYNVGSGDLLQFVNAEDKVHRISSNSRNSSVSSVQILERERRSERKVVDTEIQTKRSVLRCGSCNLRYPYSYCQHCPVVECSISTEVDQLLDECALGGESAVIPKFVYAMNTVQATTEDVLTGCCQCIGDCRRNPTCPCLLRNGQRFPYNQVNGKLTYDFYKNKLYECGPDCNCSKLTEEEIDRNSNSRVRVRTSASKCSLRLTQCGISAPMIVCNTNGKGLGVMSMQSYVKGSFICAYTGEIVSERNLIRQENRKEKALGSEEESFVTYAYEIHEGKGEFNVDSEYVGSVSRFFNHSCDPNIRPCKVVISGVSRHPAMCFFALRNIPSGEELTWKYVSGTNKRSGQMCGCGSLNCVGFV